MYWRFRDSLLKPSSIAEYIDNTKKTVLYFLILVLLFILPNLIYIITTGGISNSEFNAIISEVSESELIPYKIENNQLNYTKSDVDMLPSLVDSNKTNFSILFTSLSSNSSNNDFASEINKVVTKKTNSVIILFTKDAIVGGFSFNGIASFQKLMTYEEINISSLNFNEIRRTENQNELGRVLRAVHQKYETFIILVSIPSLLIGGVISLIMLLLIPVFISYIFNRGLQLRFNVFFKAGIYAFTPYVFATLISVGNTTSFLAMLAELLSLVYLFIALNTYYLKKVGGVKNEL